MHRLFGWIINALVATLSVLATIVLVYALQARRLPDLQPWHTRAPPGELQAAELDAEFTLDRYLERERLLFEETRTMQLQSIPARLEPQLRAGADQDQGRCIAAARPHRLTLQHACNRSRAV